jgi:hypothetical protein
MSTVGVLALTLGAVALTSVTCWLDLVFERRFGPVTARGRSVIMLTGVAVEPRRCAAAERGMEPAGAAAVAPTP